MRELQGVMYLGRGDFNADVFWKNTNGLPMETDAAIDVSHVESKWPALGQYLRDGLSQAEEAGLVT
jgi:hypothetical protein